MKFARRLRFISQGFVLALCCAVGAWAGEPAAQDDGKRSSIDLSQQVWALQNFHEFDLSATQLKKLKAIWTDIKAWKEAAAPDAPANPLPKKYVALLRKLREALIKDDDADTIEELRDDLSTMREDDNIQVSDHVTINPAARASLKDVLKIVRADQIASYLAAYESEIPDPAEILLAAAEEACGAEAAALKKLSDEKAEELGPLLGGSDPEKAAAMGEKIKAWLAQWRATEKVDFKTKSAEIEKSAQDFIGDVDSLMVLRHWVERDILELLSNPQLGQAIDDRLKAMAD